ncbi:SDR family NAD(P)-dependent oxidoreductase [Tropicimonas sp. TH_r6]|uniref:SDR family NAD(P)-dependent oxidoreductase n=1 Tax=Tropicimonas sp. TH_r6 TaxID=3082085 RepID=UPI0029544CA3|nr:SDR family NAD(P)-dependent oxidoreductase [Tropicimonas sp. TH_r6]MDV7145913.1 SDR family NAD(P)-dependent oxidoreductase [Tropicimonas sp. TH_r6]
MKTIVITGATDGIGLETAKRLASEGHRLLLHGRNPEKLSAARQSVSEISGAGSIATYLADLSDLSDTAALADAIAADTDQLDVIINNAGIFRTPNPITADGHDIRFMVNTIAPFLLTEKLLPLLPANGRIINLSSAAQSPVSLAALEGKTRLEDMEAYAQSKLAITMWTRDMADRLGTDGPAVIAVNPGSLLASKMVKEGFGVAGSDLGIGASILRGAALSEEFATATGKYFDNDSGNFASPHPAGLSALDNAAVVAAIRKIIAKET